MIPRVGGYNPNSRVAALPGPFLYPSALEPAVRHGWDDAGGMIPWVGGYNPDSRVAELPGPFLYPSALEPAVRHVPIEKNRPFGRLSGLAEREGFEPSIQLPV